MTEIKKRLAEIEKRFPKAVKLTLNDGSIFLYRQGPLKLFSEILEQADEFSTTGRQGPLISIVRRAVKSEGFGRQLLAMAKALTPEIPNGG